MAITESGIPPGAAAGQQPTVCQVKVDRVAAELRHRLGGDANELSSVELITGTGAEYHLQTTRGFSRQRFCDLVNAYAPSESAKISSTDIRVYGPVDAYRRRQGVPDNQYARATVPAPNVPKDQSVSTLNESDTPRVFVIKEFYLDRALNLVGSKAVARS
jgi:hypothetical protein